MPLSSYVSWEGLKILMQAGCAWSLGACKAGGGGGGLVVGVNFARGGGGGGLVF